MTNNLLLYGSVARGDSSKNSDVDLLSVVESGSEKVVSNCLNVSLYQYNHILGMAEAGSLFVYHLNKEAKILVDEGNVLHEIVYDRFKKKMDYRNEVNFAFHLAHKVLALYPKASNYTYINAKMAWCLRTVYAGLGADLNTPIFSVKSAVGQFGPKVRSYLNIKNRDDYQMGLAETILNHLASITDSTYNENEQFEKPLMRYRQSVVDGVLGHFITTKHIYS
jgi:predicted nucleotidyltransferase